MPPPAFSAELTVKEAASQLAQAAAWGREKRAYDFAGLASRAGTALTGAGQKIQAGLTSSDPATHGLYGAGLGALAGGLYGGVAGATGERKKSPWSTALSGALAGGAMGGGGALAYHNLPKAMAGVPKPAGLAEEAKATAANASLGEKVTGKLTGAPGFEGLRLSDLTADALGGKSIANARPSATSATAGSPGGSSSQSGMTTDAGQNFFDSDAVRLGGGAAGAAAYAMPAAARSMQEGIKSRNAAFPAGVNDVLGGKTPVPQDAKDFLTQVQNRHAVAGTNDPLGLGLKQRGVLNHADKSLRSDEKILGRMSSNADPRGWLARKLDPAAAGPQPTATLQTHFDPAGKPMTVQKSPFGTANPNVDYKGLLEQTRLRRAALARARGHSATPAGGAAPSKGRGVLGHAIGAGVSTAAGAYGLPFVGNVANRYMNPQLPSYEDELRQAVPNFGGQK